MCVLFEGLFDEVRFSCSDDDLSSALNSGWTYLIIDVGNVHDKVDIVSKVIL